MGKPNPLIYSRAAAFAMRTAQALHSGNVSHEQAAVISQLYVDDPALVFMGKKAHRNEAMDLILLWWLALGIPLAWKRGGDLMR